MVGENNRKHRVSTSRAFSAAARHLLGRRPHGAQAEVARGLGMSRAYLNDLVQGRKAWPLEHMDRFAEAFELTVPELVMMGAEAVRTGHWFPHPREVQGLLPHSVERAWAIFRLASVDMNVVNVASFLTLPMLQLDPLVQAYLGGSVSDAELYEGLISKWRILLERYLTAERH